MANFVKSSNLKIFPSGFRGGHDKTNIETEETVTVLFDPESKLSTERNLTNLINFVSRKIAGQDGSNGHANNPNGDGVIIDVKTNNGATKVEFLLHGYYFQILNLDTVTGFDTSKDVYAHIKIGDHASQSGNIVSNTGFKANTLENLESGDKWDNLDSEQSETTALENSMFQGLSIDNSSSSGTDAEYTLKLFDAGTGSWESRRSHINDFRFDITDIQSTSKVKNSNETLTLKALASAINQYFESESIYATNKFTFARAGQDEDKKNITFEVESGDENKVKGVILNSEIDLGNESGDAPTVNLKVAKIKAMELNDQESGDINEIDLRTQEVEDNKTKYGKSSTMVDLPRTARTEESGDINAETLQKVFKEHYVDNTKYGNKAYDAVPEGYMQIRINQSKSDVGDIITSGSLKSEADVIETKSPDDEFESSWIRLNDGEEDEKTGLMTYQWIKARWPAWNKSFLGMRVYSTTNYSDAVMKDISDRVNKDAARKDVLNSYSGGAWKELTGKGVKTLIDKLIFQQTLIDNAGYADPLNPQTQSSFTKFDSYTSQYEVMDYCWLAYYDKFKDPVFVTEKTWTSDETEPGASEPAEPTEDNPVIKDKPSDTIAKDYVESRFGGTWEITNINEIYYETEITGSALKLCHRHWIIQARCTSGTKTSGFKSYKGFIALNTIHDQAQIAALFGGAATGTTDWEELTGHTTDGQLHQWKRNTDPSI